MRELIAILLTSALLTGCVTTKAYNAKVAELDKLRADDAKAAKEREAKLQEQIAALEAQLKDTNAQLKADAGERDDLRKQLDDATALAGELKKRLEKLGQNVDKLTSEKGAARAGARRRQGAPRGAAQAEGRGRGARRRRSATWSPSCAR